VGVHARWWVFEKEALLRHAIGAGMETAQCQLCLTEYEGIEVTYHCGLEVVRGFEKRENRIENP
jgi:hypothetical protein